MKRLAIILLLLGLSIPSTAQESRFRIAVFVPSSSETIIDDGTKIAIREIISSTVVNTERHTIVERSLLEKVIQEQAFSQSGVADDSQMAEIGKRAGGNKIIVSVITRNDDRNMLSIKMIDVKTAGVERQKVKVVTSGELPDAAKPLTLKSIGTDKEYTATGIRPENPVKHPIPVPGEIVVYLPPCHELEEEKQDEMLEVKVDKETIGTGTLSSGFTLRAKNLAGGEQQIRIVGHGIIKFAPSQYNYFEYQVIKS